MCVCVCVCVCVCDTNLVEFCQTSGDFVALSPKSYIAVDGQGKTKQSQKGVSSRTQSGLDQYLDCLYRNELITVETCQLIMKQNRMTRVISNKKALNNKLFKFDLDRDGIIAQPLKIDSECL